MAKQIQGGTIQITCSWPSGTPQIRFLSYTLGDDGDAGITRNDAVGVTGFPRDLTSGELTGTLQAFLDACEQDAKDAEGVV